MTRTVPFTKASLRRVADVAREKDLTVIIRPDGTLVLQKQSYPQADPPAVEQGRDVVL
jgi:hypothetical protein